ncbi:MAG: hypothetical protein IT373_09510 [Polyangiaceae bacterium]|nr:hypothetical protein [Polyangiaceae bacterium]
MGYPWIQLCGGALALLVSACADPLAIDNNATIFIRQVQAAGADCSASPDPAAAIVVVGVVDPRYATSYRARLLVGNQLVDPPDAVLLTRVDIVVADLTGATLLERSYSTSAEIPATSSSSDVEYGIAVAAILVDGDLAALAAQMASPATVVVQFSLSGTSVAGVPVRTAPFHFPLRIAELPCTETTGPAEPIRGVCDIGQDVLLDCRCAQSPIPAGCQL